MGTTSQLAYETATDRLNARDGLTGDAGALR